MLLKTESWSYLSGINIVLGWYNLLTFLQHADVFTLGVVACSDTLFLNCTFRFVVKAKVCYGLL